MARKPLVVLALALAAGLLAASCDSGEGPGGGASDPSPQGREAVRPPSNPYGNPPELMAGGLVQKLDDAGQFKLLRHALTKAEALHELKGQGPVTVFAPTDDAFRNLPDETADALNRDLRHYKRVLLYHMVPGEVTAADLAGREELETLAGAALPVTQTDEGPAVGGAPLVKSDIEATNGRIHAIGEVLLPPDE